MLPPWPLLPWWAGIIDDRFLDTHKRLAGLVHRYDSRVFLQIAAFGGKGGGEASVATGTAYTLLDQWKLRCGEGGRAAPSAIESPNYPEVPRELTIEEIEQIIQDFAQAAALALEVGYDGVELHGGHTYLVGAFVSPHTNRRQDKYGGDFERRMRFPVEIVQAIRREVGDDYPVGFKFSAWEELEDGVDLELGIRIAQRIAEEGVCYLHVSSTSATLGLPSVYPSLPTMYAPRNTLLPLAKVVKEAVKDVPVMAAGAIGEPDEAEEMIASGDCDLVALGRSLLADLIGLARRGWASGFGLGSAAMFAISTFGNRTLPWCVQ